MGKKPKKKVVEVVKYPVEVIVERVEEPKVEKVSPFHLEFNNEGLNQLRDKVNELIEFINK